MRELRLIGVHDDGEHLLLTEDGDNRFTVPIDNTLRTALKRAAAGPSADVDTVPVPEELRPRDVQALLRAGVSVADVAERAGWSIDKVERYEGPIRAEREHIAGLARDLAVSGGSAGRTDTTFGQRVEGRLDGRGVDADDVVWDSWRGRDGGWTLLCSFPAGGRQRRATWTFDVRSRTLEPTDDEARWLGEDDGSPGPLSAGSGRDASVYDVEAEGGLNATKGTPVRRVRGGRTSATAVPQQPETAGSTSKKPAPGKGTKDAETERPVDLVAAMRERSKNRRRKGKASERSDFPEDAAPREKLDTTGPPPPVGSHPSEEDLAEAEATEKTSAEQLGHDPVTGTADLFANLEDDATEDTSTNEATSNAEKSQPDEEPDESTTDPSTDDAADNKSEDNESEGSAPTGEPSDAEPSEAGSSEAEQADEPADQTAEKPAEPRGTAAKEPKKSTGSTTAVPDRPSAARKGRPSVPSWDDIMFGRRPGRD